MTLTPQILPTTYRKSSRNAIIVALLIVFLLALGTYHFHGRNYRQDEAWRVHFALTMSAPETLYLFATDLYHLPMWQLVADGWITLFGHAEPVTRYMSTLTMALTLAAFYRSLRDLFDHTTAMTGIFLLGTTAIVLFLGYELRPYPMLLGTSVGATWCFLRWLRKPRFFYVLGYVVLAGFGLVVHYYGFFVVFGHLLFFVIFVRWNPRRYARAFGVFALTGLTFTPYVLPMLHKFLIKHPSGIDWYAFETNWAGLTRLYDEISVRPVGLGLFLFLLGVMGFAGVKPPNHMQFRARWQWGSLIAPAVGITALAFAVNLVVGSLTSRNMIIIVPALAGMTALGLRTLSRSARWLAVAMVMVPAVTSFRLYSPVGPHFDILETVDASYVDGAKFVIEGYATWVNVPINYYLTERLRDGIVSQDSVFHIIGSHQQPEIIPGNPPFNVKDAGPEALAQFQTFIADAPQIWWIRGYDAPFADEFAAILAETFTPVGEYILSPDEPYVVTDYRRTQTVTRDIIHFGETITLLDWISDVGLGVQPCDLITVQSTWKTDAPLDVSYSLSLVLTQDGNGIANVDRGLTDTPSGLWAIDQPYTDTRTIQVPCEIGKGAYPLLMTVYDPVTVERLFVSAADGAPIGEYLFLTTVNIR